MAKMKKLSIFMTEREYAWGWLYLALELFILPGLISGGNAALPQPLPDAAVNFLFFCLNFLAVAMIFRAFLKRSIARAGRHFSQVLKAVILGFAAYWVGTLVYSTAVYFLFPWFSNVNDGSIAAMAQESFLLMAIGTVVLVPMVEEVLYRGLLFQGLYRFSRAGAYLTSTLVFAAIHVVGYVGVYDPMTLALCFLQYIPAGLSLAWAYAEADNIFAPILIHTVINAMGIYSVR